MSDILVVEDEEILAEALEDILRSEGHRVRKAHNGREALESLALGRVDLVLLDMMMPVMDGHAVLEVLRRDSPTTAVLVVTSAARDILRGQHVEGFLRKPFSLDGMLAKVRAVLELQAARMDGSGR